MILSLGTICEQGEPVNVRYDTNAPHNDPVEIDFGASHHFWTFTLAETSHLIAALEAALACHRTPELAEQLAAIVATVETGALDNGDHARQILALT